MKSSEKNLGFVVIAGASEALDAAWSEAFAQRSV